MIAHLRKTKLYSTLKNLKITNHPEVNALPMNILVLQFFIFLPILKNVQSYIQLWNSTGKWLIDILKAIH